MEISIIVCTYNRCESLKDTLQALKAQKLEPGISAEILVIDNNSKDNTRGVAAGAAASSPLPLRYVFEGVQGISAARNRGIAEAKGDYLLFTDDDIIPGEEWAQNILNGFRKFQADCVGGAILPLWLQKPPDWLQAPSRQFALLAMMDKGSEPIIADKSSTHFIVGANMAFTKAVLKELGIFRTELGAVGNELMRGEDTDIIRRLILADKKVVYLPDAPVRHKVQPERMELSYMRKWQYDAGKSFARGSKRSGMPRWMMRECLESGAKAVFNYAFFRKLAAVGAEERFWNRLGMLMELWRKK